MVTEYAAVKGLNIEELFATCDVTDISMDDFNEIIARVLIEEFPKIVIEKQKIWKSYILGMSVKTNHGTFYVRHKNDTLYFYNTTSKLDVFPLPF